MKVPCPGCGTMLEVTDSGCQLCLRGRSKGEILRDIQRLKAAEKEAKLRPWKILAAVVLTAAAGKLTWERRARLSEAASAAKAGADRALQEAADPKRYVTAPTQSPAPQASTPPPPTRTDSAPTTHKPSSPGRGAPIEEPAPDWSLPQSDLPPQSWGWTVRGFVYDIVTARPSREVQVFFLPKNGGQALEARTSTRGVYEVQLPKRTDYDVRVRAEGMRSAPIEDADPPYRSRSLKVRERAAREAREYTSDSTLMSWNENLEEIRQDLVLVPSR